MEYSVLMSVYYKENPIYFSGAIESILKQTIQTNDFVIVCDGPLTEELDRVIDFFCQRHPVLFNIIRLKENVGLANALNEGITKCRNDIVVRMDSDDIALPERVEKQINKLVKENLDIVSGTIYEFDGEMITPQEVESEKAFCSKRELPIDHEDILTFAKKRTPFNHPAVMYRKSAVISCGCYEDYRFFEDYNLWVAMLMNGCKTGNLSECVLYMRAGREMYKRRGGFAYVKCILRFYNHMRKIGFISIQQFIVSSSSRVLVSVIPNGAREFVYSKFLRKK